MARRSDGEGSIGKRKDGTFYGAVRLDGKRHWVYGDTRKEVVDQLKALAAKHEQGASIDGGKLKLGEFLDKWLDEVVQRRNKSRTHLGYENIVKEHLKPKLGQYQLVQLRPDRVQQFINELAASGKSPRTIRNIRAVLRQALNQAIRWRYITINVATLVELPRVERFAVQPFTKDEARTFLDSIKGHYLEVLYLLALFLGLRLGELLGLLVENIDFDAGTLRVEGSLQYVKGKLVRQTTKTKSSQRVLPLPPSIVELLKAHLKREQERFPESSYVFHSEKGGPLSPFTVTPQFQALLKKAGLRHIRFHDLRHSCATFLIARGEHPRVVMDILGHSNISITMDTYGHVLDGTRTTAVAGLDEYLSKG
jgi:integrase